MSGFHPDAIRLDGPTSKTGYAGISGRTGRGAVFHSMEGPLPVALGILVGVVPVSWHFSVPKQPLPEGPYYQHYPIETVCWCNGSPQPNERYFGIEHEGVAGELLTAHQIECDASILAWAMDNDVVPWPGFTRQDTLWEHRELYATACPSGRIPWEEVINMAMTLEEMKAAVAALQGWRGMAQAGLDSHNQRLSDLEGYRALSQAAFDNLGPRVKTLEDAAKK